jgi:hypothetical protein
MNWTKRETALAHELLDRDAPEREFMDALGRTKTSAKKRLQRAGREAAAPVKVMMRWTEQQYALALEMLARGDDNAAFLEKIGKSRAAAVAKREAMRNGRLVGIGEVGRPVTVSAAVRADAARRAAIEQSPIARLLGEPLPGYSALDRRRSA